MCGKCGDPGEVENDLSSSIDGHEYESFRRNLCAVSSPELNGPFELDGRRNILQVLSLTEVITLSGDNDFFGVQLFSLPKDSFPVHMTTIRCTISGAGHSVL